MRAMQLLLGMAVLLLACAAAAQQPIVYPAQGQSVQQQSQDEAQCSAWAKQSTVLIRLWPLARPATDRRSVAANARGAARGAAGGGRGVAGDAARARGRGGGWHHGGWPSGAPGSGGAESASASPATGPHADLLRFTAPVWKAGYTIK
jgi:hypothetical protein